MSVAVAGRDEPYGVLSVYTDSARGFTEEDVHFVQSVANVLSATVERCRGEEERARLLRGEREARREAEEASHAKDHFAPRPPSSSSGGAWSPPTPCPPCYLYCCSPSS